MKGAVGFGVFSTEGGPPRVGFRVGGGVLDLASSGRDRIFAAPSLNAFLAEGPRVWEAVLERVQREVSDGADLVPLEEVSVHLPFEVGDYVDFYSSLEHATNLGRLFRPDAVIGFDLDGLFLRRDGTPSAASLKGVLADEALFERGVPRARRAISWAALSSMLTSSRRALRSTICASSPTG